MEGVERRAQDRARYAQVNAEQRTSPSLYLRDGFMDENLPITGYGERRMSIVHSLRGDAV